MGKRIYYEPGTKFGRLTILENLPVKNGDSIVRCICECDNEWTGISAKLKCGHTKSCGCLDRDVLMKRNIKHGEATRNKKSRLYSIWSDMRKRCNNPNHKFFKYYGGRGIVVYSEWNNFVVFSTWAMANGYKEDLELDRKDNDGHYSSENCRWVTRKDNMRNTRFNRLVTINGKTKPMAEWSEIAGLKRGTIQMRLKLGWPEGKLLIPPIRESPRNYNQKIPK